MLLILANLSVLATFVHQRGGSVSFEWPRTCKGWKLDDVIAFLKSLPFHRADFDGCCFGLQTKDGIPLKKEWTVWSTCSFLLFTLNGSRCCGDHSHARCLGRNARLSARYPQFLARTNVCFLRKVWCAKHAATRIDMGSVIKSVAPARKRFRLNALSMSAQPLGLPPLPFRQEREQFEAQTKQKKKMKIEERQ